MTRSLDPTLESLKRLVSAGPAGILAILKSPQDQAITVHRTAALEDAWLIVTVPAA